MKGKLRIVGTLAIWASIASGAMLWSAAVSSSNPFLLSLISRAVIGDALKQNKEAAELFEKLVTLKLIDLYKLKATPNPCMNPPINRCLAGQTEQVRAIIDLAIDTLKAEGERARAEETQRDAWKSQVLAGGSLIVSLFSLIVSGLAFRQKAREERVAPTPS